MPEPSTIQFCNKQIEYWEGKSKEASEKADLKLFEVAEKELNNYKEMLKCWNSK